MTKDNWIKHLEDTEKAIRPSLGGNIDLWLTLRTKHVEAKCSLCLERLHSKRANTAVRLKHQAMRDLGLVRVKGALE